jgi:tetratricopeptide (TPR) repeat protein
VWNLGELGRFEEAVRIGEDGVRESDALDHPFYRVVARLGLGMAAVRRGEWMRARDVLEEAVALSRGGGGFPSLFAAAAGWLASAYTSSGRLDDAVKLHREGLDQAAASGLIVFEPLRQTQLGETLLRAGQIAEAATAAKMAVKVAREHAERGHEAWALRLLGDVSLAEDVPRLEPAGHRYRESLTLGEELGMRPLVAHCHLGLAKLYQLTDKRQEAQEHFTTATTLYREMDMRFWLEQATFH